MFIIAAIVFLLVMAVIVIFAFPQFSPIPYFPSNMHDMDMIIKSLGLKNGQTIFDLGAGDGVVILRAAEAAKDKGLSTRFVAVEINPILVAILHIRRLAHPNRSNIRIVWGDLFTLDYSQYVAEKKNVTVYLYVTPRLIPRILEAVKKHIGHYTAVSYYYSLEDSMKPTHKGVHNIFVKNL